MGMVCFRAVLWILWVMVFGLDCWGVVGVRFVRLLMLLGFGFLCD